MGAYTPRSRRVFLRALCGLLFLSALFATHWLTFSIPTQHSSLSFRHLEPLRSLQWAVEGGESGGESLSVSPKSLRVSFEAFGKNFELRLFSRPLYAADGGITIVAGDGGETRQQAVDHWAYFLNSEHVVASAVVRSHDKLHLVVHTLDEIYQLDPVDHHRVDLDEHAHRRLLSQASSGHVLVRFSDGVSKPNRRAECVGLVKERIGPISSFLSQGGSPVQLPESSVAVRRRSLLSKMDQTPADISPSLISNIEQEGHARPRRQTATHNTIYSHPPVPKWTNCYAGDVNVVDFKLSVAADFGYVKRIASQAGLGGPPWSDLNAMTNAVQTEVATLITMANTIYEVQLNVRIVLDELIVSTEVGGLAWNMDNFASGACGPVQSGRPNTIDQALSKLSQWRLSARPVNGGVWSQLTDCYYYFSDGVTSWGSAVVGLAWKGTLCEKGYAQSTEYVSAANVVTWQPSGKTWITFAHELGHNFGADHSFELGQGTTGGIMDYGNNIFKLDPNDQNTWYYQFNTQFRKTQVCAEIDASLKEGALRPSTLIPFQACWQRAGANKCGNGLKEGEEECDAPDSPCCSKDCLLLPGTQCLYESSCCNSCRLKLGKCTPDGGGDGLCVSGKCERSKCSDYGGGYPWSAFAFCTTFQGSPTSPTVDTARFCGYLCRHTSFCPGTATNPAQCCAFEKFGSQYNGLTSFPAGTICSLSPLGECKNNICVLQTSSGLQYNWKNSSWPAWGTCPVTCGGGVQTRFVFCASTLTGQVAPNGDADCASAEPKPATTRPCNTVPCPAYTFQYPEWPVCPIDCEVPGEAGVTQTRTRTCVLLPNNITQPDTLCTGPNQPLSRTCPEPTAACPVAWKNQSWTSCSKVCGGGTQTRVVKCYTTQNKVEVEKLDSLCISQGLAKPSTSQSCNTQICPQYIWTTSKGTCPVTCGGGVQTNAVTCREETQNIQVADTFCDPATKPVTTEPCNTQGCPSYVHEILPWTACSKECGSGLRSRVVYCVEKVSGLADKYVAMSVCESKGLTTPVTQENCNTCPCPKYLFKYTSWTACSLTCGGGTRTRQVFCKNMVTCAANYDQPLDFSFCSGTPPPATEACNEQACPVYVWSTGSYGNCLSSAGAPVACGGGTETRIVTCVLQGTTTVMLDEVCSTGTAGSKPDTQRSCNTQPCDSYNWVVGAWGACTAVCNGGIRIRSVECKSQLTGLTVAESKCADVKPDQAGSCNTFDCPVYWKALAWGTCSVSCGGGVQTRVVECRQTVDELVVSATRCSDSKPTSVQACNQISCPVWITGPWSACDSDCGPGTQTREALCTDYQNRTVDINQCISRGIAYPSVSQVCSGIVCPRWVFGDWTLCSAECEGGIQTREVTCLQNSTGTGLMVVANSICEAKYGVPLKQDFCNLQACPRFYYATLRWSKCSVSCGGGVKYRVVECRNIEQNQAVDDSNCDGTPPVGSTECNTAPCPIFVWYAYPWQNCSSDCGAGAINRVVECRKVLPGAHYEVMKNENLCDVFEKPVYSEPCQQGNADTCGKGGVCDEHNRCECFPGFGGRFCNEPPSITNVEVDLDGRWESGVPFSERLTISWQTTGNISQVGIALLRVNTTSEEWSGPIYLAPTVPILPTASLHFYDWTIDHVWPFGTDYKVMLWFSPTVHAESSPFTIADGRSYISCGAYGTVAEDASCHCVGGWSGEHCAVSPCTQARCSPLANCTDLTGLCTCPADYKGVRCNVPNTCDIECLNGGVAVQQGNSLTEECSSFSCTCRHGWVGDRCDNCSLKCAHGFLPSSDCTVCECGELSGFTGRRCNCQYMLYRVRVERGTECGQQLDKLPKDWTLAAQSHFVTSLVTDLSLSLRINPDRIQVKGFDLPQFSVVNETDYYHIYLAILDECAVHAADADASTMVDVENTMFRWVRTAPVVLDLAGPTGPSGVGRRRLGQTDNNNNNNSNNNNNDNNINNNSSNEEQEGGEDGLKRVGSESLAEVRDLLQTQLSDPHSVLQRGLAGHCLVAGYGHCLNCLEAVVAETTVPPLLKVEAAKETLPVGATVAVVIGALAGLGSLGMGLYTYKKVKEAKAKELADREHFKRSSILTTHKDDKLINTDALLDSSVHRYSVDKRNVNTPNHSSRDVLKMPDLEGSLRARGRSLSGTSQVGVDSSLRARVRGLSQSNAGGMDFSLPYRSRGLRDNLDDSGIINRESVVGSVGSSEMQGRVSPNLSGRSRTNLPRSPAGTLAGLLPTSPSIVSEENEDDADESWKRRAYAKMEALRAVEKASSPTTSDMGKMQEKEEVKGKIHRQDSLEASLVELPQSPGLEGQYSPSHSNMIATPSKNYLMSPSDSPPGGPSDSPPAGPSDTPLAGSSTEVTPKNIVGVSGSSPSKWESPIKLEMRDGGERETKHSEGNVRSSLVINVDERRGSLVSTETRRGSLIDHGNEANIQTDDVPRPPRLNLAPEDTTVQPIRALRIDGGSSADKVEIHSPRGLKINPELSAGNVEIHASPKPYLDPSSGPVASPGRKVSAFGFTFVSTSPSHAQKTGASPFTFTSSFPSSKEALSSPFSFLPITPRRRGSVPEALSPTNRRVAVAPVTPTNRRVAVAPVTPTNRRLAVAPVAPTDQEQTAVAVPDVNALPSPTVKKSFFGGGLLSFPAAHKGPTGVNPTKSSNLNSVAALKSPGGTAAVLKNPGGTTAQKGVFALFSQRTQGGQKLPESVAPLDMNRPASQPDAASPSKSSSSPSIPILDVAASPLRPPSLATESPGPSPAALRLNSMPISAKSETSTSQADQDKEQGVKAASKNNTSPDSSLKNTSQRDAKAASNNVSPDNSRKGTSLDTSLKGTSPDTSRKGTSTTSPIPADPPVPAGPARHTSPNSENSRSLSRPPSQRVKRENSNTKLPSRSNSDIELGKSGRGLASSMSPEGTTHRLPQAQQVKRANANSKRPSRSNSDMELGKSGRSDSRNSNKSLDGSKRRLDVSELKGSNRRSDGSDKSPSSRPSSRPLSRNNSERLDSSINGSGRNNIVKSNAPYARSQSPAATRQSTPPFEARSTSTPATAATPATRASPCRNFISVGPSNTAVWGGTKCKNCGQPQRFHD